MVFVGGHATFHSIPDYRLSAVEMATEIRLGYSNSNIDVNGMRFRNLHGQEIFIANGGSHVTFLHNTSYGRRDIFDLFLTICCTGWEEIQ